MEIGNWMSERTFSEKVLTRQQSMISFLLLVGDFVVSLSCFRWFKESYDQSIAFGLLEGIKNQTRPEQQK